MITHCDVTTGKIFGCKKGSWKWFHEKGHLIFNTEKSYLVLLQGWFFNFWVFFLMVAIVFREWYSTAVTAWAIYIFLVIYEEWWCNKYADGNYKKTNRNR